MKIFFLIITLILTCLKQNINSMENQYELKLQSAMHKLIMAMLLIENTIAEHKITKSQLDSIVENELKRILQFFLQGSKGQYPINLIYGSALNEFFRSLGKGGIGTLGLGTKKDGLIKSASFLSGGKICIEGKVFDFGFSFSGGNDGTEPQQCLFEKIIQLQNKKPKVFEVGAGYGTTAHGIFVTFLNPKYKGFTLEQFLAIDINYNFKLYYESLKEWMHLLNPELAKKFTFGIADFMNINLEEYKGFNIFYDQFVIHYIKPSDHQKFVQRASEILEKNGVVLTAAQSLEFLENPEKNNSKEILKLIEEMGCFIYNDKNDTMLYQQDLNNVPGLEIGNGLRIMPVSFSKSNFMRKWIEGKMFKIIQASQLDEKLQKSKNDYSPYHLMIFEKL
jgi:hypothetical protein